MLSTHGKLSSIYIGERKGEAKIETEAAELIEGYGLRGDSHAGIDANRQVSLFSNEIFNDLVSEGFSLSAGDISANLFIEHLSLDSLEPGTKIRIGETLIEIVEARKPCRSITQIDNRLPKRLYGNCGQLGRILKGGIVRSGDEIEILSTK